jgi:hypothetical protein
VRPELRATIATDFRGETLFFGAPNQGCPAVGVRLDGEWSITRVDPTESCKPAGVPDIFGIYGLTAAADSDHVVLIGTADRLVERTTGRYAHHGLIWSSEDGRTFRRAPDPRTLLGGNDMSVRIVSVKATEQGFLATGDVAPVNGRKPAEAFVIQSGDGIDWSLLARFQADMPVGGVTVHDLGAGHLVIEGTAWPCEGTLGYYKNGAGGFVTRLWESVDAGTQWRDVDIRTIDPVIHAEVPVTKDADCPKGSQVYSKVLTHGEILGAAGGRLVAITEDGVHTATSADLKTWVFADVPGATALPEPDRDTAQEPEAMLVTADADGIVLRELQHRRTDDGRQREGGCQVWWWRSTDAGTTWTPGPLARPLRSCQGGYDRFLPGPDGVLLLEAYDYLDPGSQSWFRVSAAGPAEPWGTCVPGPAADCEFVTLTATEAPSADWSAINLYGATLQDVRLREANLAKADLFGVIISGDLSGANLRDTAMTGATLERNLAGVDLRGAIYNGASFVGDMRGANFTNGFALAASFKGDLTGAKFGSTTLASAKFLPGTTCPDGKPATKAPGAQACRL